MTGRDRFHETMRGGAIQPPLFEEGLRDDVLERWRAQGLTPDADLARMFHYDGRERVPMNIDPLPDLQSWPTSRSDLKILVDRLDSSDPARLPEGWVERARDWRAADRLIELFVHPGFFLSMGVHGWSRFEQTIFMLHDAPDLVQGILEARSAFMVRLIDRVLRDVTVDYATFSEPIGGNDRPLLSPRAYKRFVLATYAPIVAALRDRGVRTIVFMTYANSRVLLPAVVEAGFDCLWACEANMEAMDYRDIRREFGRDLRLIGGIDLDILRGSKESIRREMEAVVPSLLAEGGYIPLADGRVRQDMPFENYVFYRRLLEEMTAAAAV